MDGKPYISRPNLRNAKCTVPAFHLLVTVQQTIVEKNLERPFTDKEDVVNDALITWHCTSCCASWTGKFYAISFLVILFLTYMLVTNSSLGVKSYCYPVHDVTVFR